MLLLMNSFQSFTYLIMFLDDQDIIRMAATCKLAYKYG